MEKHVLSKSKFIRGVQCLKSLYLDKKRPFLRDKLTAEQLAKFKRGSDVGILAQQLFPGGINLKPASPSQYRKSVLQTKDAIESGEVTTIYEAAFQFNGVLVLLDILVHDGTGWKAYEVKSSKSVSDTYLLDAALQYHVIRGSGLDLKDISIIYVNENYIKTGELELTKLFITKSVLDKILPMQRFVRDQIVREKKTLQLQHSPSIDIGVHCFHPYPCDFRSHCWKHIPSYSVFNLHYIEREILFDHYLKKIITPDEIRDISKLSGQQRKILKTHLQGNDYIDCDGIAEKIKIAKEKTVFLHVLISTPAVPVYDQTSPYQPVPVGVGYKKSGMQYPSTLIFEPGENGFHELSKLIQNELLDAETIVVFNQLALPGIFDYIEKYISPVSVNSEILDLADILKENLFVPIKGMPDFNPKSLGKFLQVRQKMISHAKALMIYQYLNKASAENTKQHDKELLNKYIADVVSIIKKGFDFYHKKCNIV